MADQRQQNFDFVIIGGGIVGIATALELQSRQPSARIVVIEKETALAQHQSSHNSGVIHAGVYYAAGSMKARFCREGMTSTREFCDAHEIYYEVPGKLIVATTEDEVTRMAELKQRATTNQIPIEDVDQNELRKLEPNISGLSGLLSPTTGIVNYAQMTLSMAELFTSRGGVIKLGEKVISGRESATSVSIETNKGLIDCAHVIACAGLYSDKIISAFGRTPDYRVIPFRGEYFRISNQPKDLVRHLIYPVPDPERPFLGVHLTRKLDCSFTVGPNAVLAFKREGYKLRDISIAELAGTLGYVGFWRMLAQNAGSAVSELTASLSKRLYLKRVQQYCSRIKLADLSPYAAGVRAQAVARDGKIIDDFLFVKTERCLHVANAPSPAATSCIPIARHIIDELLD